MKEKDIEQDEIKKRAVRPVTIVDPSSFFGALAPKLLTEWGGVICPWKAENILYPVFEVYCRG